MSNIQPTAIQVDKPRRTVVIPWNDGTTCEYPFDGLRDACPCAECAGGHEHMGQPPDPNVFKLTPVRHANITHVELVGGYGLQIIWGDGHSFGIYTWEYLHGLCPNPLPTEEYNASNTP